MVTDRNRDRPDTPYQSKAFYFSFKLLQIPHTRPFRIDDGRFSPAQIKRARLVSLSSRNEVDCCYSLGGQWVRKRQIMHVGLYTPLYLPLYTLKTRVSIGF